MDKTDRLKLAELIGKAVGDEEEKAKLLKNPKKIRIPAKSLVFHLF